MLNNTTVAKNKSYNIKPYFPILDENNSVKIFESIDPKSITLSFMFDKSKTYSVKLNSDEIQAKKDSLIKYAEKIDSLRARNDNLPKEVIEKDQSFINFLDYCDIFKNLVFSKADNFMLDLIEFSKKHIGDYDEPCRIDFVSEEFTFPIELICFNIDKAILLGESFLVCRRYISSELNTSNEQDGLITDKLNLAYIPTADPKICW
jgi:hypothetical protein